MKVYNVRHLDLEIKEMFIASETSPVIIHDQKTGKHYTITYLQDVWKSARPVPVEAI